MGLSQEEEKFLDEIMCQSNISCEELSKKFTVEFQDLLDSLANWLGLSQVAFATTTLVVVRFLLEKVRVSLDDVVVDQPLNIWGVIIAFPGREKTLTHKSMS